MLSKLALVALGTLAAISDSIPTLRTRDDPLRFNFGTDKVRGVNLGGWLVLEPWINVSLFDNLNGAAVDEYTFCQTLGQTEAYNQLYNHWKTWITPSDFAAIAQAGFNFVRIPIGYWSVIPNEGDPYVQGAYDFLGSALDWAQQNNLMVIIDLHGAPGSQNGFDNSGRYGSIEWTTGDTVTQTKNVLNKIRDDHASHPAVAAIELLNEPMGTNSAINTGTLKQFMMDGWGNLESSNVAITFHDAFLGVTSWNDWGSGMWNLLEDTHHYEVFDQGSVSMSVQDHVNTACGFSSQMTGSNKWTISGEWSGAMTDCAKYLNGYGKGARYDGSLAGSSYVGSCAGFTSGSVSQLDAAAQQGIRRYVEAQLDAFEQAAGWVWWCWKTEQGAPGWDMQDMLANKLFPQPITDRQYPNQCGF